MIGIYCSSSDSKLFNELKKTLSSKGYSCTMIDPTKVASPVFKEHKIIILGLTENVDCRTIDKIIINNLDSAKIVGYKINDIAIREESFVNYWASNEEEIHTHITNILKSEAQAIQDHTTSIRFKDVEIEFIKITAGRLYDQKILPYYISIYPITFKQYNLIMRININGYQYINHPIAGVSWDDAKAFCEVISDSSKKISLPTEFQWENACGNDISDMDYNCKSNLEYGYKSTSPVKNFEPNKNGVYDLLGNVWEWCDKSFEEELLSEKAFLEKNYIPGLKVLRGGSWLNDEKYCDPTFRLFRPKESKYPNYGFRCVINIENKNS